MLSFKHLQMGLISEVRGRIRGGELTERGLARSIGMSQPHIHNVLKGEKILTLFVADKILFFLGLSVADLMRGAGE
jgi:plasmid maintenance system antidote protein VapI